MPSLSEGLPHRIRLQDLPGAVPLLADQACRREFEIKPIRQIRCGFKAVARRFRIPGMGQCEVRLLLAEDLPAEHMTSQMLKFLATLDAGQEDAVLVETERYTEAQPDFHGRRGEPRPQSFRIDPFELVLAAQGHMGWDEVVLHGIHHASHRLDGP